jgi:heme/copper-type cytochrome/quinol oxidase subunit 2
VNRLKQTLKKINYLKVAEVILAVVITVAPLASLALTSNIGCNTLNGLNCSATDFNSFIRIIINWMLGIAFGIAVLFLIVGGFWYITSAGNEETAEKGRGTAINAIIGIVIIILSYVIINVVSNLVTNSNSTTAP